MAHSITDLIARWLVQMTVGASLTAFKVVLFAPLHWSTVDSDLVARSRELALIVLGGCLGWGILARMWPAVTRGPADHPIRLVERAIMGAVFSGITVPLVRFLLAVNNTVVASIVGEIGRPFATHAVTSPLLGPFLAALVAAVSALLVVYLGVFYALRSVEIVVLAGVVPWFICWWAVSADGAPLARLGRELAVAVFIQSAHALVFWLYLHLVLEPGLAGFEAIGLLYYMTRLPSQLRRLIGAGAASRGVWGWI